MFKFIVDGKEILDNRIHWKFAGTELVFKSDEAKLERNIQFWRDKHKVGPEVEVEFLYAKKLEEDVKPIISEPAIEHVYEPSISESATEPVVPQDPKDSIDTPKRKPGKKASKL